MVSNYSDFLKNKIIYNRKRGLIMTHGLSIRGDSLYCPLSFSLDSYGNCLIDCAHCYLRRLNYTWGQELRSIDTEELNRKLKSGLKNKNPKSSLDWALKQKKTLRFGNKADPFQPIERELKVSKRVLEILIENRWETVIQTMVTTVLMDYVRLLSIGRKFFIVQPIISPGLEKDWELLEGKKTTHPIDRLEHLKILKKLGVKIGVNGEPFIPGYHTVEDFENTLKVLISHGIFQYNTYNFHLNDYVAKRMIPLGIDMEKVWEENQDIKWKKTHQKLIDLAIKYGVNLGCPDFINSGDYLQRWNTCCGITVKNPTTYNTHWWKIKRQYGEKDDFILKDTWDGIGDKEEGKKILKGMGTK